MHTLPFSELDCPYPATAHPYAPRADQQTLDWALAQRMIPETAAPAFGAAHVGLMAGYLAPHAAFSTVRLLSDWIAWGVLWDDVCDRPDMRFNPLRVAGCQRMFLSILRDGAVPRHAHPLAEGLLDLRRRLLGRLSPVALEPFISAAELFFAACQIEIENRTARVVPAKTHYLALRRASSGIESGLYLVALLEGFLPPASVRRHPAVTRAQVLAINAFCIANDLISLPKELASGDVHNLVIALQHNEGLSRADAWGRGVAQYNATVQALTEQVAALPSFGPADCALHRYAGLLQTFLWGSLAWAKVTNRYCAPSGAAAPLPLPRGVLRG
ncbi:MAG: hypothetical protein OHK0022_28470 [Roseiflexaceae bacterium]